MIGIRHSGVFSDVGASDRIEDVVQDQRLMERNSSLIFLDQTSSLRINPFHKESLLQVELSSLKSWIDLRSIEVTDVNAKWKDIDKTERPGQINQCRESSSNRVRVSKGK